MGGERYQKNIKPRGAPHNAPNRGYEQMKYEIRQPDGTAIVDLTPGRAVRLHCLECVAWSAAEVRECGGNELLSGDSCKFYPHRLGRGRVSVKKIHAECIRCMGGDPNKKFQTTASKMVTDCRSILCCIWSYREGRNPVMQGRDTTALRNVKKGHLVRDFSPK